MRVVGAVVRGSCMERSKGATGMEGTVGGAIGVSTVEEGSVEVAPDGKAMVWGPVVDGVTAQW